MRHYLFVITNSSALEALFLLSVRILHIHSMYVCGTYLNVFFYTKTKLLNRANRDKQNKQLKVANDLDCQYKYLKKSPVLWII